MIAVAHRLAIGLEPREAWRGGRVVHPLRVEIERGSSWSPAPATAPYGLGRDAWRRPTRMRRNPAAWLRATGMPSPYPGRARARFDRYDSGRYALLYSSALPSERVSVRIYDHHRRYVPRRLSVPLLDLADAESRPPVQRVRRPTLFPGANYDFSERSTGIRGRVLRDSEPARWVRVEARRLSDDEVVGRAQGDDRGEFLLLLAPAAEPQPEQRDPLRIHVAIAAPSVAPSPPSPELPELDEYWDLPLEELPAPGLADGVSPGVDPPDGYAFDPAAGRDIDFALGEIASETFFLT